MRVQVVKANRPTYWYANFIGNVYEVEQCDEHTYVVVSPIEKSAGYFIDICDTVEVKKISCKIGLSWLRGQAREVASEAIQKKLFEADVKWADHTRLIQNKESAYLFIDKNNLITKSDEKGVFERCKYPEVSVNNALKGNFWTYSSTPKKEEPKPEGYKVSLAAYTGKAQEAISKAIQEEAFKKGYGWGVFSRDKIIQNTDAQYLFFEIEDKCILKCTDTSGDFYKLDKNKELSVEEILSGALPKVN